MRKEALFLAVAVAAIAVVAGVLMTRDQEGVTLYCATDEDLARPIVEEFEKRTGIRVKARYDTEAVKTVGLVTALREEAQAPRADVFWNNEILHSVRLANEGLFEPYVSPSAADLPDDFKHPDGLWTGFAARARILIVNTDLLPDKADWPTSMHDLTDPKWKDKAAFVRPLTGTTLTHSASMFQLLGREGALGWFEGMHENGVAFPSGNGPLAKMVAQGNRHFGFTDTDDFRKVEVAGYPVARVYPDQGEGEIGTMFIPNTVGLVKGGPQPELGKQLIDFLLSKDAEALLAELDSAQIPLRGDVPRPDHVLGPPKFRAMKVNWDEVAENFDARLEILEAMWE